MNKVFIGMVVAVCFLGMALLMLNERLSRKPEVTTLNTAQTAQQNDVPDTGANIELPKKQISETQALPENIAMRAENAEIRQAEIALESPLKKADDIKSAAGIASSASLKELPEQHMQTEKKTESVLGMLPENRPAAQKDIQDQVSEKIKPVVMEKQNLPKLPEQKTVQEHKPAAEKMQQPKADKSRSITRFVVFARDKGATVRFGAGSSMHFKNMFLENPPRMVIDLDGDWSMTERLEIPRNELVNSVRMGKVADKTRIVIDLKEKPKAFKIIPGKNNETLDVRLDK